MAVASNRGEIEVWDLDLGSRLPLEDIRDEPIYDLAWNPTHTREERLVAVAGTTIRIWNAMNAETVETLSVPRAGFRAVAWSYNGEYIAAGDDRGNVHVWRPGFDGAIDMDISPHVNEITSLIWLPHSADFLAASADYGLSSWSVDRRKPRWNKKGHTSYVKSVCLLPGATEALTASGDGTVCRWQLRTGDLLQQTGKLHAEGIRTLGVSRDGELAATSSFDETVVIWRTANWSRVGIIRQPCHIHNFRTALRFHPISNQLAVLDLQDSIVRVFDIAESVLQTCPFCGQCARACITNARERGIQAVYCENCGKHRFDTKEQAHGTPGIAYASA